MIFDSNTNPLDVVNEGRVVVQGQESFNLWLDHIITICARVFSHGGLDSAWRTLSETFEKSTLSDEEKIGRFFLQAVASNENAKHLSATILASLEEPNTLRFEAEGKEGFFKAKLDTITKTAFVDWKLKTPTGTRDFASWVNASQTAEGIYSEYANQNVSFKIVTTKQPF